MKRKNTGIDSGLLVAGVACLFATWGIIALRKFLNDKSYEAYYNDFHRNFDQPNLKSENYHGVEYLAMH